MTPPKPEFKRHRKDDAQDGIVAALRAAGAEVEFIGRPVDLLVGFRQRCYIMEVKNPGAELKDSQKAFFESWPGQAAVVHTPVEALEVLGLGGENFKGRINTGNPRVKKKVS